MKLWELLERIMLKFRIIIPVGLIFSAKSDREWKWFSPILFRKVIAVMLSKRRSTVIAACLEQKDCSVKNDLALFIPMTSLT